MVNCDLITEAPLTFLVYTSRSRNYTLKVRFFTKPRARNRVVSNYDFRTLGKDARANIAVMFLIIIGGVLVAYRRARGRGVTA